MRLSIVIPAFNEAANLPALHRRLTAAAARCSDSHEIIVVDDGSTDSTADTVRALAETDPAVKLISLSRNFGHEAASTAGLDHATGDAVVLIDADLQDPPEIIPEMVERWRAGAQVVYAQRRRRAGETAVKRMTAYAFYRILSALSDTPIPLDTGDFRLMDRRAVEALRRCRESPRFVRGLVAWIGFRQEAVQYDREARHAGTTNYTLPKLLRLSLVAISSFSLAPLRAGILLGLGVLAISIILAGVVVAQRLVFGVEMLRGYAFLACSIFFLAGVQLTMLGVIAHYLGQVFTLGQGRPLYLIAHHAGFEPGAHIHAPEPVHRTGGAGDDLLVVRRQAPHHPEPAGALR